MKSRLLAIVCFVGALFVAGTAAAQSASFTASPTTGCAPLVVNFTNTSTGTGLSYYWDFGNGVTSTLQHPATIYLTPGAYTVKLRITDASGAQDSVKYLNLVTASPAPTVNFVSPDTTGPPCGAKTVGFLNTTVLNAPGGGSYEWDFGEGITYTTTSAGTLNHSYTACGNYTVTMVASNSAGCAASITKDQYIKIGCGPTASFSASNTAGCATPHTVSFNGAASAGAASYSWNFGDGSPLYTSTSAATTHTYTAYGSYSVTLIVTSANGCTDTLVQPGLVTVNKTTAGFTPSVTTICQGAPVSFSNTSTPAGGSSTWYFKWPSTAPGDMSTAASPVYAYNAAGTFTVKLVYNAGGCPDTATRTITVLPKPALAFTGSPLASCTAPLTVNFTNTSTGSTSYTWLFGDGGTSAAVSPAHTYTATGNYEVWLIGTSAAGCKDTLKKPNYVQVAQPTANINGLSVLGCAPVSGAFTLSIGSVLGTTSGYSYSWNWGDGSPVTVTTGTAASHLYTTPGTYVITVTGTGSGATGGCSFTTTKTVVVGKKPTAAFTPTPDTVCVGHNITFNNTSLDGMAYAWSFGDGNSSVAVSPVHAYNYPGTYTVTLIATNGGCSDTVSHTVTVLDPMADFTYQLQSCGDRFTICFNNISISAGPTTYQWDFGVAGVVTDTSSALNPCFTFPAYGGYTVTLTTTNLTTGCVVAVSKWVPVFPLEAKLLVADTNLCRGTTGAYTAQYHPDYAQYGWNWGDGSPWEIGGTYVKSHPYTTPGTYTLTLWVRDIYNCTDTLKKTIKVTGLNPGFTAAPLAGCTPLPVNFTDTATALYTTIANHAWYFGETAGASTSTGAATTASHTYMTQPGSFSVKLVYTLANGCKDSITRPSLINTGGPTANFTITPGLNVCKGATLTFSNTSSGTGLTYNWFFPDGSTSTSTVPAPYVCHTAGVQPFKLVVTNPAGCKDSMIYNVTVNGVTAAFTMSDSIANCPPMTVNFTNTSFATPGAALSYSWNFGNGSTSSIQHPNTIYNTAGTFTPKLIVTSAFGCKDSATKTILVHAGPTATLEYAGITACAPETVCFNVSSIANSTGLAMDFQDGTAITTPLPAGDTTICHVFHNGGTFMPVLVMSNAGTGCVSIIKDPDTIRIGHPKAGFMASPNPVCQFAPVAFTDTSSTPVLALATWNWNFDDPASGTANTSTLQNPSHAFQTPGAHAVRLIVADASGCADTVVHTIVVQPAPAVNAGPDAAICVDGSTTLTATGADAYSWTPAGSSLSCYSCAAPVASPVVSTTYVVTGTDGISGCSAKDTVEVLVLPLPAAPTAAPVNLCQYDAALPLTATTAGAGYVLNWYTSPTGGTPLGAAPVPVTTVPGTFTWYVSQSAPGGASPCEGPRAVVTVTVHEQPAAPVAAPVVTYCQGATAIPLTATATTGTTLRWYTTPVGGTPMTTAPVPATGTPGTTVYYVGQINSVTGCEGPRTAINVVVVPLPPAPVGGTVTYCQYEPATPLTATAATGMTLQWYTTPSGGTPLAGAPTPVTTTPGTFTWYVAQQQETTGCEGSRAAITVIVSAKPVVGISPASTICYGSSATLSATGATTYTWSPAITCGGSCATGTVTPTVTTTYTVVGETFGCKDTNQVTITVLPLPEVTVTPVMDTLCAGESVLLTAAGAATYSWSPTAGLSAGTGAAVMAAPTATTTYQVIGSVAAGSLSCYDTASVQVVVNPKPAVSVSGTAAICAGAGTTLTATGADAYSWSPATGLSATTGALVTAHPDTTTTYTIIGTNATGCSDTVTKTVTVNSLPVVTATTSTPVVCPGSTAILSAEPVPGMTYSWSPAVTCTTGCATATAIVYEPTTFTVTGTHTATGCTATDTVTVNVYTPPTVTVSSSVPSVCPADSAQLTATGAASYTWLAPATGLSCTTCAMPNAAPPVSTVYTVIGTDANGCKDTATVSLSVYTPPAVSAGPNSDVCLGSAVTLGASGAVTYQWSPAATLSSSTVANPVATPTDTTLYTVIGTDIHGCKDTATTTVFTHQLPAIDAGMDTSVCPGFGVTLQAAPTAGLSFVWTPATGLSATNIPNPVAAPVLPVTYHVTATDAFGCQGTDSVHVSIRPVPEVTVTTSADSVCKAGTAVLTASGAFDYQWLPGGSLSNTLTVHPLENTVYTVIGTNSSGCKDTITVPVNVYPELVLTTSPDVTICEGASVTLTATGAAVYAWSPVATLSSATGSSTLAMPDVTTVYTVIGTDIHACMDTAFIKVTVVAQQPMAVEPGGEICKGGEWRLSASGGTAYNWYPATGLSNPNVANPIARPDTTTTYTVTIVQGNCFTETQPVTVTVKPTAEVSISSSLTMLAGSSLQLSPAYSQVDAVLWTPADALSCTTCDSPLANPARTTTYTVYASNASSCNDTATVTVQVLCDGSQLWLPNTFSPNGDGNNDRFYARGRGVSRIESFRIFNRWGEVVYEARDIPTDDVRFSWDGTYKGQPLNPDVFIYVIQATCNQGETVELKGDISIVR